MKKINKLPSISRVSPGNVATLEIPLGPTYERIVFDVTAAAGLDAADINRITVLADGKPIMTFKNLQRLMYLNAFYGRDADTVAATAMQFALHFFRGELENNTMRAAPGIGTKNLTTFHIEMEIAAGAPADIAIKAHALIDPAVQDIGAYVEVREFPFNSAVSGQVEQDKLPRNGVFYAGLHLFKADISAVEVEANQVKIVDATKGVLERFLKGATPRARVPQTAVATHIDFLMDGNIFHAMPTAGLQDFRVKMTLDTAGAVDVVTETINTLA